MHSLDPVVRDALAQEVLRCLRSAAPGAVAELRGSLAAGTADAWSDIDVLWELPDDAFCSCVGSLREMLAPVHPVRLLRSDPDLQRSDRHRLLFVHFENVPLFWRVDIEAFARCAGRNPGCDLDNASARGGKWSAAQSALMNAVAAIKGSLRGHRDEVDGLLERGFARVGRMPTTGPAYDRIVSLARCAGAMDPGCRRLADEVVDLAGQMLGE